MDQRFNKVFWGACANGDFAMVCAEIKKSVDINYQNGDGRAGLMRIAKRGYEDIVRMLLDNGAEVNLGDNKGKTVIMGAAKKGDKTICKKSIEAGADVNTSDDRGRAALVCATFLEHDRYVETLLDAGARINAQDEAGRSVSAEACVASRKDVVCMLTERNADVNLCDNNGCTALMRAAYGEHMGLTGDLLVNGVDRDLADKEGHKATYYVREDCLAQLKPIPEQEVACMRDYLSHEVRNVVVLGHSGVGKTIATESMLYFTKVSDHFGATSEGSSLIDCDPEEIRCGISVYASLVPIEWEDRKIDFIDTPGYTDFIRGVEAGIAAGDNTLIVVDAKDAVRSGTIKAQETTQKRSIPTVFSANKLSEDNTFFDQTHSVLRKTFGKGVILFEVPIMENGKTIDSVNVLHDKAWHPEGSLADPSRAQPVLEDTTDVVAEYKNQIAEAIIMNDDELMEKYFSDEEFNEAEPTRGIRLDMWNGEIRPVLSGSVTHSVGTERLMGLIVKYFLTYGEAGGIIVSDAEAKEPIILETNKKETLCAQVFKTVVDPSIGCVPYIKALAGMMNSDSAVYNATKDRVEKISTISIVKGKHQTAVEELFIGDIRVVVKLQATQTNDTLCKEGKYYLVRSIQFSEPILGMAVFPNSKSDEDKMSSAPACMVEEDLTLRLENNEETKQAILYGTGDQCIDVVLNRLKNEYKVEVRLEAPKVPYHETIRKTTVGESRHKRQSDGHGQFGHAFVEFAPNPDEGEMVFEEKVFGGVVPRQYFPAVETGLRECMQHGLLAGYKVVNIKVTLLGGKYHDVDSSEMAFRLAAHLSYKAGVPEAKPILLEPVTNIIAKVPDEFIGIVINDFNKCREAIMGMDMVDGYQEIIAQVSLAEVQKYPTELYAMIQERGVYTQGSDRYEPVPSNIVDGIIAQHRKEEEE